MDDEELYDSLEEEFASSTSLFVSDSIVESKETVELKDDQIENTPADEKLRIIKDPPSVERLRKSFDSNNFQFHCNTESEADHREDRAISTIVPLYGGDKVKTEVEIFKNSSSSSLPNNSKCERTLVAEGAPAEKSFYKHRKRSIFTYRKNSPNSCTNLETLVKSRVIKSYLGMFQSRSGCPGGFRKREIEDSVRSIFGDTERSLISDVTTNRETFKDAEDGDCDSLSFYFNQIQADGKNKSTCDLTQTPTSSRVGGISPTKFNSYSGLLEASVPEKLLPKAKQRSRRTNVVPIPILGGLGPDITAVQDKLERRKIQLSYGQKASNRNRIKMMEMKVLQNLKDEIQKSNVQ